MLTIRSFIEQDWPAVWGMIEPVFRAGETYAYPRDITEKEAHYSWIEKPLATYVAEIDGKVSGTYYIKSNQEGPGSHVCNCGYIVSDQARGQGIASEMCAHSQQEAVEHGFLAMQFNLVVSTNEAAVRVWQRMGFEIVGRIPKAFNHPLHGLVDAFVMYKELVK